MLSSFLFFFNDTATTDIYTLSLHDALPISSCHHRGRHRDRPLDAHHPVQPCARPVVHEHRKPGVRASEHGVDRKSTRLNSSHSQISYAVFCLKKKKKKTKKTATKKRVSNAE